MKCSIYSKPGDMTIEERPDHVAAPDQVVVKVERAGVCGSDVTAWTFDGATVGVMPNSEWGHEFAGVVEQVGADVKDIAVGDRVWVNPVTCKELGMLAADMAGAFSEKVLVEKAQLNYNVYKLPDNVPMEHAALIEPFCVGTHGKNVPESKPGDNVVIFGDGPIGLCALSGLVGQGVENVVVVGHRESRLKLVEEMGGIPINSHDPDYIQQIGKIFGTSTNIMGLEAPKVDVYIDCAGAPKVTEDVLMYAQRGARYSIVAVSKMPTQVLMGLIMAGELKIMGSSGYTHEDIVEVIDNLANKRTKIEKIITHRFKHADLEEALNTASSKEAGSVKVIIEY